MWVHRIGAVLSLLVLQAGSAASINYGDFIVPSASVTFGQVTESSGTDPVPLFGPPTPYAVGLDFNPTTFSSSSSDGPADITDGQLNFTIASNLATGGAGIQSIFLGESGDYTLTGAGTAATSAIAGLIVRVTVTEIDGLPIAPINLTPINASFSDALPGAVAVAPWSLGLFKNIASELAGLGKNPVYGATRLDVAIDNTLVTTSERSTSSLIRKTDFNIEITIPEPASLGIASMVATTLLRRRKAHQ